MVIATIITVVGGAVPIAHWAITGEVSARTPCAVGRARLAPRCQC